MTAKTKTENLHRMDLPLNLLEPHPDNPNKMSSREFDLLVTNMTDTGWTDPALVRPLDLVAFRKAMKTKDPVQYMVKHGVKFRIVGGHHRVRGGEYLDFDKGPCTIIDDDGFGEDEERFQLVRHNAIHGRFDANAFVKMYDDLSGRYADEIMGELLGFADEADFRRLIKETSDSLPEELRAKFKEAASEIKTIDELAVVLNRLFTMYGDTLPYSYMVFDYGGTRSIWLRSTPATMKALDLLGDICIRERRSMDDVVGEVIRRLAAGGVPGLLEAVISAAPVVEMPEDVIVSPTLDNIEALSEL